MHPDYRNAEDTYQGLRDAVYDHIWSKFHPSINALGCDLRIFPIDEAALQQVETLWGHVRDPRRPEPFEWREIFRQVRTTPRRFDMAIWNGSLLSGLVVGKASRGAPCRSTDPNLTLSYLQAAPRAINSMRGHIAVLTLEAALAYATLLDRKMLYLRSPLPAVVPFYQRYGFSIVSRKNHGMYMGLKVTSLRGV